MSEFSYRNLADIFRNTRVITSHQFNILSWSPEPVEVNARPTEIHIFATAFKIPDTAFIIRLKSRTICQELIDGLQKHMADIWPEGETDAS